MPRGGAKPGAGRPKGGKNKPNETMVDAKESVIDTGLLPHEWLREVALGNGVEQKRWSIKYDLKGEEISRELITEIIYAQFTVRIDAAKAAAPYYAPRLASQLVSIGNSGDITKTLKDISEKLPV